VREFSTKPGCILRIAFERLKREIVLPDGLRVKAGEEVASIHFWNERMPSFPRCGVDIGWGGRILRLFEESLRELAEFARTDQRFRSIRLVVGTTIFFKPPCGLARRFGFHIERIEGADPWERFLLFWPRLFGLALIWAFNPAALVRKPLRRARLYRILWPIQSLTLRKSRLS